MFGIGEIATALAAWYGYKTLGSLVAANSGLIVVLLAFLGACLVFSRMLNRKFPRAGQPVKTWVFKAIIVFMICAFTFICAFTLFYERKKYEERSDRGGIQAEIVSQV